MFRLGRGVGRRGRGVGDNDVFWHRLMVVPDQRRARANEFRAWRAYLELKV